MGGKRWTLKDLGKLVRNYPLGLYAASQALRNRTPEAIKVQAGIMGIRMKEENKKRSPITKPRAPKRISKNPLVRKLVKRRLQLKMSTYTLA